LTLDECADQAAVANLLSIISHHSPHLPIKFFITRCPEQLIRNSFHQLDFQPHSKFILHNIDQHTVSADIEICAKERLVEIAGEGRSEFEGSLDDWPPERELKILVDRAANLFIYAATACEYIASGGSIQERLAVVTTMSAKTFNGRTYTLDALYSNILGHAYNIADSEEQKDITDVLRAVVSDPLSMNSLSVLLRITREKIRTALSCRIPSSPFHHLEIGLSPSQHFMHPFPITSPTKAAPVITSLPRQTLITSWDFDASH
jgi:hypothetical protein